ncbi:MAG: transcriptional regulator swi6 [Sclerophora amabilis]|nr:MAG: transcriptional regulator swi6 [Sclerophora amabilis]
MASALHVAQPSHPPPPIFSRSDTSSSLNLGLGRPPSSAGGPFDDSGSVVSTPTSTPQTQRTQMSYFQRPPQGQGQGDVLIQQNGPRPYSRDTNGAVHQGGAPGSQIYTAMYSGVSVYEMEVNHVAVMRRRCDSWLNATQILKVAGIEKGKRTKVLEKEILIDEHEKVQGGYGKYQGTWINYQRGVHFCRQYGVEELLRPLLEYDMGQDGMNAAGQGGVDTPTKEQAMAAQRKRQYNAGIENRPNGQSANGTFFKNISSTASNAVAAISKARIDSPAPKSGSGPRRPESARRSSQQQPGSQGSSFPGGSQQSLQSFASESSLGVNGNVDSAYGTQSGAGYAPFPDIGRNGDAREPPRKKLRPAASFTAPGQSQEGMFDVSMRDSTPTEPNESFVYRQEQFKPDDYNNMALEPLPQPNGRAAEEKKQLLMSLFLDQTQTDFSNHPALRRLSGEDLDLPLDTTAHTALHWAATLARIPLLKALISQGASIFRMNTGGETALIRAVLVTNNHDQSTFSDLLQMLGPTMEIRDGRGRTVLHHIAVSSAVTGRSAASRYYLNCLLEFVVRRGGAASSQQISETPDASAPPTLRAMGLAQFISEIVDAQDRSGDTALNIAARINNTKMISQLLEIGANTGIPNRAGLKPLDFGIGKDLEGQNGVVVNGNHDEPEKTISRVEGETSRDIMSSISSLFSKMESDFVAQSKIKQDLIDATHAGLRECSVMLGDERRKLAVLQKKAADRVDRKRKIVNLRRALSEKDNQLQNGIYKDDATHVLEIGAADSDMGVNAEGLPQSALAGDQGPFDLSQLDQNQFNYLESLPSSAALSARLSAYTTNNTRLKEQASQLRSQSSKLEDNYRRVISLCTKVAESEVDKLLGNLVAAVESEGGDVVDLGRVRDFLRKAEDVDA